MNLRRTTTALLLGTLTMAAVLPAAAQASGRSPSPSPPATQTVQATQAAKPAPRRARASLSIHAAKPEPWVGQAIPVTVTAVFRDVEGVTLEGIPAIASKAIVTSDIAKDPRQSTEVIDGERVVVARWAATVTPSAAGPLELAVELPVHIRYREAAPRAARAVPQGDPLSDLDLDPDAADPFDTLFNRLQQRMQQRMLQASEESAGRVREETLQLKASTPALEVRPLPTANQPATFTGAVGTVDLDATISARRASVTDPLTLRIAVGGDVDLDRVDLPGIASSSTWKAYPPRVVEATAADAGKAAARVRKKIFEQVLVPLRGGELTVPEVSLTAFDPSSGKYVTRSTRPLLVTVDGVASPAAEPPPLATSSAPRAVTADAANARASASSTAAPAPAPAPEEPVAVVTPLHVLYRVLPVLLVVLAAVVYRLVSRKRGTWALRRSMRRAAGAGRVEPFLGSAHRLIAARLSERWGLLPDDVTASRVRERLGPGGEPLVDILVADAALRFGRGGLEGAELGPLCKSVEQALRGAT